SPPDLDEIGSILADIVEDDKRAGEVIERLRDLLRKGDFQATRLDVNTLVRDVARILGSDALIRGVSFRLDTAAHPTMVDGDRIQLQQVILNLTVNAMDAMASCAREDRIVVVRTGLDDVDAACVVSVMDSGMGFDESKSELIFQPFYTTKQTGMGM